MISLDLNRFERFLAKRPHKINRPGDALCPQKCVTLHPKSENIKNIEEYETTSNKQIHFPGGRDAAHSNHRLRRSADGGGAGAGTKAVQNHVRHQQRGHGEHRRRPDRRNRWQHAHHHEEAVTAPAKLARQMTSFGQAYRQLDVAYAMHRKQKSDEPQPDGGDKE